MTRANPVGPTRWPMEEWEDFDRLTNGLSIREVDTGIPFSFDRAYPSWPTTLGGLLDYAKAASVPPEVLRKERLSALWGKVKSHAVWKRLSKDQSFRAALKLFMKRQASGKNGYAGPYAELRFLNIVSRIVTFQANFPDARPKYASLATNKAALTAARRLQSALETGVSLDRWSDNGALRALLAALADKLSSEQGKRKRRSDELLPQRFHLDQLISSLLTEFKDASPAIVARVAEMMGYTIEATTIDRRIKEVKATKASEDIAPEIISPLAYLPKLPLKRGGD